MKRIILGLCLLTSNQFYSQNENEGLVKWLTLKEAQEKNKTVAKPMLIDIYTDWCGWCKHMMKTTYSNQGLAEYINTNFYPVKFDAETKDTIEYNGVVYKPLSPAPRTAHELAIKFLGKSLSYPSTMFVANSYSFNLLSQGFLEDKKIEPLLIFMVENAWQTVPYDEFAKHFNHTFTDTNFSKVPVKIYPVTELENLQKKKPKKVLVFVNTDFCNTGKVMSKTTFNDTGIANYVNKNYYLSFFNATSTDTIRFKSEKFFNTPVNGFPLNTLAFKLSNNRFSLPALCILDEQLNFIDVLNYYQSPEKIKYILKYIASDNFKKKSFNDFMQEYMHPKSKPAPPSKPQAKK